MDKLQYHGTSVFLIIVFTIFIAYVLWELWQFFGWIKDEIAIWKMNRGKK